MRPKFTERWRRRIEGVKLISQRGSGFLVKGRVRMRATLSAVKIARDGTKTHYGVVSKRLVTRAFVKRLAAQMAVDFSAADEWKWHASGTGSSAEANTETALVTEVETREAGTQADVSAGATGNYRTVATHTYGAAFSIREHGIFNASSAGTMLDRSLFAAITVGTGDSIEFTYDLEILPE